MGERRTDGEIGVRADFGEGDGTQLREREERTPGDRVEHDVALADTVADARPPEGATVAVGGGDFRIDQGVVQDTLGLDPADRSVGLAVITEELRLLGSVADEVGRHRGVTHLHGSLHAVIPRSGASRVHAEARGEE